MNLHRPDMRTGSELSLLRALIVMNRPQVILEIGTGNGPFSLARDVEEVSAAWVADRSDLEVADPAEGAGSFNPTARSITTHACPPCKPRLFSITGDSVTMFARDDSTQSHEDDTPPATVELIEQDLFAIPEQTWEEWGPIDLVWIRAKAPSLQARIVSKVWEKVRPGGYLAIYSSTAPHGSAPAQGPTAHHAPPLQAHENTAPGARAAFVRNPLWEELSSRVGTDFELLTLTEPHTHQPSGLGLIRKLPVHEQEVGERSLQQNLLSIGDVPVRNDFLPAGLSATQPDPAAALIAVLCDNDSRRAYAAVLLGAQNIATVVDQAGIPVKAARKAISRLFTAGLITSERGVLLASNEPWANAVPPRRRDRRNLTDLQLETPELLSRITQMFAPGRWYPESVVSEMCAAASPDHARLRRKLVDDGYLIRQQNQYRRPEDDEDSAIPE